MSWTGDRLKLVEEWRIPACGWAKRTQVVMTPARKARNGVYERVEVLIFARGREREKEKHSCINISSDPMPSHHVRCIEKMAVFDSTCRSKLELTSVNRRLPRPCVGIVTTVIIRQSRLPIKTEPTYLMLVMQPLIFFHPTGHELNRPTSNVGRLREGEHTCLAVVIFLDSSVFLRSLSLRSYLLCVSLSGISLIRY